MAVRRETIKRQFSEALAAGVLEPGEQVVAGALSQSGPSPWLAGAIGVLVMLAMGMHFYFIAATDRRVIFMKASMWSQRPQGLAWSDPRGAATVTDIVADARVWNSFKYLRPGESKPLRLNVSAVVWKDDARELIAALSAPPPASSTGMSPVPPPPPAP
ncbi:MAG: hypothetical protein HY240_10980 [Actinobacteria bacterium]|nr:hypothetical protein [Actinomycetota bacterium]